jgi:hypothetical protein
MPLQALVPHEQELHRLIEGYFVAAQKLDPPGRADARHGRLHLIRIDALGIGALEAEKYGAIGTVADARERERPIKAHGNLARRREQAVALEARATNSCAARIGPIVCELDGPMPILKMSNTLNVIRENLFRPPRAITGSRCRPRPRY